ncbi:MAG: alpha/beta hydrolase [Candidatus Levybacteria bacterium]|nr:alpha/beta hydrolase [Candidatus Levybacteria bacterium]
MNKIIILHGWTKNLDKWKNLLESLKKNGIDADLPKIPGLTGSLDKVWDLDDYIDWLKEIVNKQKDKVILIGHSNGGRITLAFTNRYPEKIEKLVLIDSAGIYRNELPLKIKRIVFRAIAKVGKRITPSRFLKNLLYKLARESDYKDLDENIKKTMINLISNDLTNILPQIKIPTLIIWGGKDKVTPLSDGILMNNLIKHSKLKIIKDAHHSPMFTHPKEVTSIILNSLGV